MVRIFFEDVTEYDESIDTYFGFNGWSGVIRNEMHQLVGFFTVSVDGATINLSELEIIADYQEQGYGREFLNALFDRYSTCYEIVGTSLASSTGFYKSVGAEVFDTCRDCKTDDCSYSSSYKGETKAFQELCEEHDCSCFKLKKYT